MNGLSLSAGGGGGLALDELERRVSRIRAAWARQLWALVAQKSALREELLTVRDMFLCNRGDLWHTFVERSSPAILGWTFSGGGGSSSSTSGRGAFGRGAVGGDAALEIAQQQRYGATVDAAATAATMRWTMESFRNAMSDVRLSNSERHARFDFVFNNNNNNGGTSSHNTSTASAAAASQQQPQSFDDAGRSIFATIRLLGIKWRLPSALTHVIKPSAIQMYERLFVSNLVLKFSIFCLNQCKRFSGQAETLASNAGRHYAHCVSLLHFFLSNVAYSWQVDVQDSHFSVLFEHLDRAESVDEALRAHTLFVDNLTAGAFLAEEGRDVARCIGELVMLAFSLFALAREDSTRKTLDAIAVAEKRREQLPARGVELTRTMQRIVAAVVRRVTTVISPIASSRRAEHRALWTRLDFNGWFSAQLQKAREAMKPGSD